MARVEFTSTEELEAELARTSPLQRYPGGMFDETSRASQVIRELARRDAARQGERIAALEVALGQAADALHRLYSNVAEFGTVTDGEFLDDVYAAEQRCRAALVRPTAPDTAKITSE